MTAFTDAHGVIRERQSPLIVDAAEGNSEALSVLLESARLVVHEWATLRTQDPDDAEDVTQKVLLKLFTRLPVFRGESRLSSWLYRVTLNEVSGLFRKRAQEKAKARNWMETSDFPHTSDPDTDRIDRERTVGAIRNVACGLPPLQMAAFRLIDLGGMRPCEAARELGKSQANIRSSLCRARKKIRELVRLAQRDLKEYMGPGGNR